jgi:hypothetical protein
MVEQKPKIPILRYLVIILTSKKIKIVLLQVKYIVKLVIKKIEIHKFV